MMQVEGAAFANGLATQATAASHDSLRQYCQFSSSDWQSFLKANNVISSMTRRGNCHDSAVAESFFQP